MSCEKCYALQTALEAVTLERDQMRDRIASFSDVVEQAEAAAGSKGGQHVPYHGDFANVPPSVRAQLHWWAYHLSDATKG